MGEQKFVQVVLMAATPIYVKNTLKSSSSEPEGRWPWDLVCSIKDVGPTKFFQMMVLGWPWPTYCQGQICFLIHLNGIFFFWKDDFLKIVEAKVIIITSYIQSNETMTINKFQRWRLTFQPMSLKLESHQYLKTMFTQKPFGQLNSNFIWRLLTIS